jgi:hypothetical protein
MPAPKNNIILHDLEEGCASDLLYYIAHSWPDISYSTVWLALYAKIRASTFQEILQFTRKLAQACIFSFFADSPKIKGRGLYKESLYTGGFTWTIFCVSNKQVNHKQENKHVIK